MTLKKLLKTYEVLRKGVDCIDASPQVKQSIILNDLLKKIEKKIKGK